MTLSSTFSDLGVGVGLRVPHYDQFLNGAPGLVSFVEVISENFMNWENRQNPRPIQFLEKVRRDLPVILHGVSLSIGSADKLNPGYLRALKELVNRIQPARVSDHLCWTGVEGQNLHDLLPLPYTNEVLNLVSDKIKIVQDTLQQQILLENPSTYIQFENSDMTEWEFLAELSHRADCGILLDVNNVYVCSVNHGFDPMTYLKAIPAHRVGQIHLAGHSKQNDFLIDTHDAPVCQEVWELYRWTVQHMGKVSTMIERDDNIPSWDELEQELMQIHNIKEQTHASNAIAITSEAP